MGYLQVKQKHEPNAVAGDPRRGFQSVVVPHETKAQVKVHCELSNAVRDAKLEAGEMKKALARLMVAIERMERL